MKVQKRRRREYKTDYLKRLKLLKSGKPRVVFRKTNKYVISQYITSNEAQDKVEIGFDSRDLLKYGWPNEFKGSLKSISASYLLGYLMGKRILKDKKEKPIIDFGMIQSLHKTKVFAFVKGLIDSGLDIQSKEEAYPDESRIMGKHMKNKINLQEIKSKIDKL